MPPQNQAAPGTLRQSIHFLWKYPFSLLALQMLDIMTEGLFLWTQKAAQENTAVYLLAVFPLSWVLTTLGTASTFHFLQTARQAKPVSVLASLRCALCSLPRLAPAATVVGFTILLGLLLVLPGIYFLALYLFLPCVIMEGPKQSLFQSLGQSAAVARPVVLRLCFVAAFFLLAHLGMSQLETWVGEYLAPDSWFAVPGLFALKMALSLVLAACTNVLICSYYFKLTHKPVLSQEKPYA